MPAPTNVSAKGHGSLALLKKSSYFCLVLNGSASPIFGGIEGRHHPEHPLMQLLIQLLLRLLPFAFLS